MQYFSSFTLSLCKYFSIPVIILLLSSGSYSQSNLEWVNSYGSDNTENITSMILDHQGNIYSCGYFTGSLDINPGVASDFLNSYGLNDIFIQKLDNNGIFVWGLSIGGITDDKPLSITYDGNSNIYLTGLFSDSVDFDPGLGMSNLISNGDDDIFILKLDTAGNFNWVKAIGNENDDDVREIGFNILGSILITGVFYDTIDFDPGPAIDNHISVGQGDIFVINLDTAGNYLWAKSTGGTQHDQPHSITSDLLGNIIVTGSFIGNMDFDPGPATYNLVASSSDIFVLKLSSLGDFLWAVSCGGISGEEAISILSNS